MSDDAYHFELSSPKSELADALDELADLGIRVTGLRALREQRTRIPCLAVLRQKSAHAKLLAAELREELR